MNILQILPELNVGGVETGTVDLAKYLIRLGHRAIVISSGGELVKELETMGVKHYELPVHSKSFFNIRRMIPEVVKIIKEEEIDIVHARSRLPAWIGFFAARNTHKPFITTAHGYYSQHYFSRAMGWGKLVIVPSEVIAHHMRDNFNVPYERIRLIPRGVDLEKFEFIDPEKKISNLYNVGIIGRLTPIKGHIYFLKAMAKVVRMFNRPRIKIWIVGDAPSKHQDYKDELRMLVRRLGLEHCTEFLGTQRDIPTVLSHLNLLVSATTTQEAFGRVLVEAGASGVPVVATQIGGTADIIEHEKTGLIVGASDHEAMAGAIARLIKDPGLAKRLALALRKDVEEKFNAELMVSRTLEVYKEALSNFKIFIIKLSSVGDVILSTAAIRHIRDKFPSPMYKIKILVGRESKDVLVHCPYIDEFIVYDYKGRDRGLGGLLKIAQELRKENFDSVIDLQNNRKSHLLAGLSMAVDRYGYNNKKYSSLLNHSIKDDGLSTEPVSHQFKVLHMLGIELRDPHLEVWPDEGDEKFADEFLQSQWLNKEEVLIGINVGASSRWQTKAWPVKHMKKLCEELSKKGFRVIFTGTAEDGKIAAEISKGLPHAKLINACAKTTINQLACLIKRCKVFISADSAPLHIANAVDTPFIALFGPTDPERHLAPSTKGIVITKELACSPCYKPNCKTRQCLEEITPEEVLTKIEELLKK